MAGQVWMTNSLGGFLYSDNLSNDFRQALQPKMRWRQFCDIKDAMHQGLHKGATFHWDVIKNVATQGTTLVETTTIPETQFTVVQGTMTITEAGKLFAALISSFINKFGAVIFGFHMACPA